MIVTAIATALTRCPSASHQPNSTTHRMLPISAPGRVPGLSTSVRPNGHSAYDAIRSDAKPNGMVTMSTKQITAASR